MIAQIVVFSRKTDAQRKKNFAFRSAKIAQKFCEWKPYWSLITIQRKLPLNTRPKQWHFQNTVCGFLPFQNCTRDIKNFVQNLISEINQKYFFFAKPSVTGFTLQNLIEGEGQSYEILLVRRCD